MRRLLCHTVVTFVSIAALTGGMLSTVSADNWTRFRGPNGTGIATDTFPATWSDSDLLWKVTLPGIGHSSPVVWGDSIFLMSADGDQAQQYLLGIDAQNGSLRWQQSRPLEKYKIHLRSSYATSTPCVDEQRVYAVWTSTTELVMIATDHAGNVQWETPLGPYTSQHGFGNSPMRIGDLVVIAIIEGAATEGDPNYPRTGRVMALDAGNGEVRWTTPRIGRTAAYSVPCILESGDGRQQLIGCDTTHGMFSLDPQTGQENWHVEAFDKRTVSSPVLAGDMIFGSTGSGGGGNYVAAVHLNDDRQTAEVAYKITKQAPYVPTLVVQDGRAYLWSDKGIVTCINVETGDEIWQQRVGGNFSGSPVIAGKHIYCIDEEGTVVVLATGDKYELLGKIPLGEASRSTPAIANGRMYLRTYSHLMAVGGSQP
ncbi:MAG: PQQ-binding-like beta-propeller repeat protein [Planctomycetales bacterium]|nr:PQQ-binding-like beta-propeller repeat protein [Planctomycetales bacterium]